MIPSSDLWSVQASGGYLSYGPGRGREDLSRRMPITSDGGHYISLFMDFQKISLHYLKQKWQIVVFSQPCFWQSCDNAEDDDRDRARS